MLICGAADAIGSGGAPFGSGAGSGSRVGSVAEGWAEARTAEAAADARTTRTLMMRVYVCIAVFCNLPGALLASRCREIDICAEKGAFESFGEK